MSAQVGPEETTEALNVDQNNIGLSFKPLIPDGTLAKWQNYKVFNLTVSCTLYKVENVLLQSQDFAVRGFLLRIVGGVRNARTREKTTSEYTTTF